VISPLTLITGNSRAERARLRDLLHSIVQRGLEQGSSFCEARFFENRGNSVVIENGVAKALGSRISRGVGVRVIFGRRWGFASTNVPSRASTETALDDAVSAARSIANSGTEEAQVITPMPETGTVVHDVKTPPDAVSPEQKVKQILDMEKTAKSFDERVKDTFVNYRDSWTKVAVCNSFGTSVEEVTPRTYVYCRVISKEGANMQTAVEYSGGVEGYELIERAQSEELPRKTANKAVKLLSARSPPRGTHTVIVDQRVGGLFMHEAFGHNSEADAVLGGQSIIADKMGQKIASELVTIVDDPTVPGNGSYTYDHEGVMAEPHTIVKEGVLVGFLHSLESAAKLRARPQGSARAQSHQYPPIIRMSNTYLAPGPMTLDEILRDTKTGLYLTGSHSGYVETQKGQFTCRVEQGWLIENGNLTEHLRDVSFSGLTLDALKNISAVGKDLRIDAPGTCGKDDQSISTDAGAPHFRIDGIVVGGRT